MIILVFLDMHVLFVMKNIWISENIQNFRYIKIEIFDPACKHARINPHRTATATHRTATATARLSL